MEPLSTDKLTSAQASTTSEKEEGARQCPEDKCFLRSGENSTTRDLEESERTLIEGGEDGEDGIPSMKKLARSHRLVWGRGLKQSQCSYSSDFIPIASVNMVRRLAHICTQHVHENLPFLA